MQNQAKRSYTQLTNREISLLQKRRQLRNGTRDMVALSSLSRLTLQRAWSGLQITIETAETIRKTLLNDTPNHTGKNKSTANHQRFAAHTAPAA